MDEEKNNNLVWIDLEMTGLNVDVDLIIEIAVIITDRNLNIVSESPVIAINQPKDVLDSMNDWCKKTHSENGLIQRVKDSCYTTESAEKAIISFIKDYVNIGSSPLCGNTVYQDRKFLSKYMPELESYFHYRLLDVSTLKILAESWYPSVYARLDKKNTHLALDDIRESIEELRYYRKELFK